MSEELELEKQPQAYDSFSDSGDAPVAKAKDPKKTVKKLIAYLAPHKTALIAALSCAVLSASFAVAGPRIMGRVTTTLVDGIIAFHFGTGLLTDFRYMGFLTGWLIALYTISALANLAQETIMARLSVKVTYKLRKEISEKIHRLPINYYDTRSHGDILSRITNDVDMLSQTLNQNISQIVSGVTAIIGTLAMMFWISPLMTFAALFVIPLFMSLIVIILQKSHKFFSDQQDAIGKMSGIVEETYGAHSIVRAFNGETDAKTKFASANKDLKTAAWKAQFMTSVVEPIFGFVDNLGYVLVCVLGGYLVVLGVITIGDVQAFLQYVQNFTRPLGELGASSNMMQSMVASAERVFEFLDEEEQVPETAAAGERLETGVGRVSFQNVRFGYSKDKIFINDFSAEIEPGYKVAIVGPTGAGKTTVVKLLMRFYELLGGRIFIDGVNSTDFTRAELRGKFGMVLQDTWLYNATIMENIRYGSPDATDADVVAAAKTAQCHDFIRTLPGGYNMVLNEDATNISAGQKQLFTIARVVLKDPEILILDEATSSIDTRTEILIQKAMKNIMKGRTSFVIAHRLSTIKDADLIFVMKDGSIIEQGSHDQLLLAGGFYADLYNSQFAKGGALDEDG